MDLKVPPTIGLPYSTGEPTRRRTFDLPGTVG
jgi:hypothetical protein